MELRKRSTHNAGTKIKTGSSLNLDISTAGNGALIRTIEGVSQIPPHT